MCRPGPRATSHLRVRVLRDWLDSSPDCDSAARQRLSSVTPQTTSSIPSPRGTVNASFKKSKASSTVTSGYAEVIGTTRLTSALLMAKKNMTRPMTGRIPLTIAHGVSETHRSEPRPTASNTKAATP